MKIGTAIVLIIGFITMMIAMALIIPNVSAYNCEPPMKFAKEHNCVLKNPSEYGINEFRCGTYRVIGDCEGGVISYEETIVGSSTLKLAFVGFVVLLVLVGLMVAFRKLKDDEDYPLEPMDGQSYY